MKRLTLKSNLEKYSLLKKGELDPSEEVVVLEDEEGQRWIPLWASHEDYVQARMSAMVLPLAGSNLRRIERIEPAMRLNKYSAKIPPHPKCTLAGVQVHSVENCAIAGSDDSGKGFTEIMVEHLRTMMTDVFNTNRPTTKEELYDAYFAVLDKKQELGCPANLTLDDFHRQQIGQSREHLDKAVPGSGEALTPAARRRL